VGRSVTVEASERLAPFMPMNIEGPPGFGLRQSSGAFELSAAWPKRQGTAAVQDAIALARTGVVQVADTVVRFLRPGVREEYTVSMDGVRHDFVVLERPAGAGELAVRLAVSGARVEPAADGARLVLENSGRKIAYSRLRVTDATGKALTARMEVAGTARSADSFVREPNAAAETHADKAVRAPALAVVVNDADASYPIRVDPTFSDANWISMNAGIPGADGVIYAAVVDATGNLYIGGDFTLVGGTLANYVAKWKGHTWSALGSGMGRNSYGYSTVYALAVSGSALYAGGYFATAGGRRVNGIAKWDGSGWSPLGSGMNDDPAVSALAVSGSDLYAGGQFTTAGGRV